MSYQLAETPTAPNVPALRRVVKLLTGGTGRMTLRLGAPWADRAVRSIQDEGHRQRLPLQTARTFDLLYLLARFQPPSIVEFGSGLSTVIFARYAASSGASLTTYEENPEWAETVVRAMRAAGVDPRRPEICSVVRNDEAIYYDVVPPAAAMLYVDGPAKAKDKVCLNAKQVLDSGATPKLIVFDGRIHSVLSVLNSEHAHRFQWAFQEAFARKTGARVPIRAGHHSFARAI